MVDRWMDPDFLEFLGQEGFSELETKTYLYICACGFPTIKTLAHKLNRSRGLISEILETLVQKGLLGSAELKGSKIYFPTRFEYLLDLIDVRNQKRMERLAHLRKFFATCGNTPLQDLGETVYTSSDYIIRRELKVQLRNARNEIYIVAVLPPENHDETLLPFPLLTQKCQNGVKVHLLLRVTEKTHAAVTQLHRKGACIFHYPHAEYLKSVFVAIDDVVSLLTYYTPNEDHLTLKQGWFSFREGDLNKVHKEVFEGLKSRSTPLIEYHK